MPKKKKEGDLWKTGLASLGKIAMSKITDRIFEGIEKKVNRVKRRIMQGIMASILVGLGILAILFSIYFYLTESLMLSKTQVALFLGILLLAIGFFLKYKLAKEDK